MRDITEHELRLLFGERTFSRGLRYYTHGHVKVGIKKGNNLTGMVQGSVSYPYRVEIDINNDVHSRCTCPVGTMCKHGVALLLQWVHDKDSFVDFDYLLHVLQKKSKEDLLKIILSILEKNPVLASKLAFFERIKEGIDIKALSERLRHIREDVGYYQLPQVMEELEDIKEIGITLAEGGQVKEAGEVYLLLIEWGVEAFESGMDDSNCILSDVMYGCVKDFTNTAKELGEEQKKDVLYRVLDIMEMEDYDLGTEEMLIGLATKENVSIIEEELLKKMPKSGESYIIEYHRREIVDFLSEIYRGLGMQDDAVRVVTEAGLKTTSDYVCMAKALIDKGEHEKAFGFVQKGLSMKDDEMDTQLGELYFALLQSLPEKREDIPVEEAMNAALQELSYSFLFDPDIYAIIKDFFEKIGEHKMFISVIKEKCDKNVVINVLLCENRIDEAVDIALTSPTLHLPLLIEVAKAAKENHTKAAKKLMYNALKRGITPAYKSVDELITFFVEESDENELKEAIDFIQDSSIARLFADALSKRNQAYVVMVLTQFIDHIKKEELLNYAANLENVYAKEICFIWISAFIHRSYVYYDDIVDILKTLKGIIPEKEWEEYVSTLMEKNKGKKKFMEKLNAALSQKWL